MRETPILAAKAEREGASDRSSHSVSSLTAVSITTTDVTTIAARQGFVTNLAQFRCERTSARPMLTIRREIVGDRMTVTENGIKKHREAKKMSQAELARRLGTNRQQVGRIESSKRRLTKKWAERIGDILDVTPHELMFPDLSKIDVNRFQNVFEVARGGEMPSEPSISIRQDLMAQLLPGASRHSLQLVVVDNDDMAKHVARGDAVILDLDAKTPTRPGVYALRIADEMQWRFLSPTTAGTVLVRSDNPNIPEETANPSDLTVIGRARLKISTV